MSLVLILVLMEDTLRGTSILAPQSGQEVLILVLMEDALRGIIAYIPNKRMES